MRLAIFNVENLFRRPIVLYQPTWAEGREQLNDYTKFNGIIGKASHSNADKKWLVDFLDRYEMADRRISEEDPVMSKYTIAQSLYASISWWTPRLQELDKLINGHVCLANDRPERASV
jgi:hypothetical protein